MLRAYFDESGIHAGAPVAVIAGFIGSEQAWEVVEERWRPTLAEYADRGVRTFHMTEALTQRGEFATVDKPHLNYILTQLSKSLGGSGVTPIFSAVVQRDWDEVVTDKAFLTRFPKPFDLCFDDIVRQLALWARQKRVRELISPMFAYQDEYRERMGEVGRAYGAEPWYAQTLGPIAFGRPQQTVPLQGADMLAHEIAFDIEQRRFGSVWAGERQVLTWMTGGKFTFGHWFDADGLRLTVDRYLKTGKIYP